MNSQIKIPSHMNAAKWPCKFKNVNLKPDIFIQMACNVTFLYIKTLKNESKNEFDWPKTFRKKVAHRQYGRYFLVSIG
jgi:hypothetical protein